MNKRNWSDLSRKLVDRFDMKYTSDSYESILNKYANGFYGKGVLPTTLYPNPFPVTIDPILFSGLVGNGIAFDDQGFLVQIDPASATSKSFTVAASDPVSPRRDLLVLRYKQTGTTPIPKPSDPIITVNLNLVDDFELIVRAGTPNADPQYPVTLAGDIILAGILVPNGSTQGSELVLDLAIRDLARVNFTEQAIFRTETPVGVIDNVNTVFTLQYNPYGMGSLLLTIDGLTLKSNEYTLVNNVVNLLEAPDLGQRLYAFYIEQSPTSINPLAGYQETPTGIIDGINNTFNLSGKPANSDSMMVYVDRLLVTSDKVSLIQTNGISKIQFDLTEIPDVGQDVYVFYFVNPATIGVGGSIATAMPSIAGSESSPVPVGISGIPFNGEFYDNIIYIESTGGAIEITNNPRIAPGNLPGQRLTVISKSDTDTVSIPHGQGVNQNGNILMKLNNCIKYLWTGSEWFEENRR